MLERDASRTDDGTSKFINTAESNVRVENGRVELPAEGPLKISGDAKFSDLLKAARGFTEPWQRDQQQKEDSRKEFRATQEERRIQDQMVKDQANAASARLATLRERPNADVALEIGSQARMLTNELKADPRFDRLAEHLVPKLMESAARLDPKAELLDLAQSSSRADVIAALAILEVKARDGQLPESQVAVLRDAKLEDGTTVMARLDEWTKQAMKEPNVADAVEVAMRAAVEKGILTPEQAERTTIMGGEPGMQKGDAALEALAKERWEQAGFPVGDAAAISAAAEAKAEVVAQLDHSDIPPRVSVDQYMETDKAVKDGFWLGYLPVPPDEGKTPRDHVDGIVASDFQMISDKQLATAYAMAEQYYGDLQAKHPDLFEPKDPNAPPPTLADRLEKTDLPTDGKVYDALTAILTATPEDLKAMPPDIREDRLQNAEAILDAVANGQLGSRVLQSDYKVGAGVFYDVEDGRANLEVLKEAAASMPRDGCRAGSTHDGAGSQLGGQSRSCGRRCDARREPFGNQGCIGAIDAGRC